MRHRVDRGRAPNDFPACAFDAAAAHIGVGFGEIIPVEQALLKNASPGQRDVNPGMDIPSTGFDQQHPDIAVFGEAIGKRTTG